MENNQFSANGLDLLWVTINPTQLFGGGKDRVAVWRGASSQAQVWERRVSHSWLSSHLTLHYLTCWPKSADLRTQSKHEV